VVVSKTKKRSVILYIAILCLDVTAFSRYCVE